MRDVGVNGVERTFAAKVAEALEDRQALATWLRVDADVDVRKYGAFERSAPCGCVIARYLSAVTGVPTGVGYVVATPRQGVGQATMPEWVTPYIGALDALDGLTVAPREALAVLEVMS